jgi:hypothetical protein
MKVYRVVGKDGRTMYSGRNIFSGLYTDKDSAERALAGFKASWQRSNAPFSIQESYEFEWKGVTDDDTAPYYGS